MKQISTQQKQQVITRRRNQKNNQKGQNRSQTGSRTTNSRKLKRKIDQIINDKKISQIRSIPTSIGTEALKRWRLSLKDPFDPRSCGVKIPDPYAYPTTTFKTEGTVTLSTSLDGTASVLLVPHPYLSMINMCEDASISGSMKQYRSGTSPAWAAVPREVLSQKLANFRVVSVGYEISNLMPQTLCTGRFIGAKVPGQQHIPGPYILDSENFNVLNYPLCDHISGVQTDDVFKGIPSQILTLPGSQECTMQNLITNKVKIQSLPVSPEAYNFHTTGRIASLTGKTGSLFIDGQSYWSTSQRMIDDASDSLMIKGSEVVLLRFEGMPSTFTNAVEIKYIFHFEGTPSMNFDTVLTSATEPVVAMNPQRVEEVRSKSIVEDEIRIVPSFTMTDSGGDPLGTLATMFAKMGLQTD